jgi:tetratricopeptide (TPR) repeat protein
MVERYPNDAEAHGQLGYLDMYFCDLKSSQEESMKSLALDSTYAATLYDNSGYAAALAGDVASALVNFDRSKQKRPAYLATEAYIAHAHWVGGAIDSAELVLRAILPRGDLRRRLLTHAQLGSLLLARGQLARVKTECDSGITLARQASPTLPEAYFHYLTGAMWAASGDLAGFRKEMLLVERYARPPYTELALAGCSYARNGMKKSAVAVMDRIARATSADPFFIRRKNDFIHLVNGSILLEDGNPGKAKREFDAVEKVHCGDPLYYTARFGAAECDGPLFDSLAVRGYLDLLRVPGELVMGPILSYPSTGSWTGWLIPEIHLKLAQLYVKRGNEPDAHVQLDAAFRYWDRADATGLRIREATRLREHVTPNSLQPNNQ